MDIVYPAGPDSVPAAYTRPSASYKRNAWIAVASLLLFIALYAGLATWFVVTGLSQLAKASSNAGFLSVLTGVASLFLAAFMIKALFFMKKGSYSGGIELTRSSQPRLFAFLDRIADE